MTYSIHVSAATTKAHHNINHKDVPKGGVIELDTFKIFVLDKLAAAKLVSQGSAIPKMVPSPTAAPAMAGMAVIQAIAKVHILEIAANSLLIEGPGKLNIYARHEHVLWPTTGSNFHLRTEGKSPREVMKKIYEFLEEEDFNQWGPLVRMCEEITAFFALGPGKNWTINVTLTD